jgi:hypothetical protein
MPERARQREPSPIDRMAASRVVLTCRRTASRPPRLRWPPAARREGEPASQAGPRGPRLRRRRLRSPTGRPARSGPRQGVSVREADLATAAGLGARAPATRGDAPRPRRERRAAAAALPEAARDAAPTDAAVVPSRGPRPGHRAASATIRVNLHHSSYWRCGCHPSTTGGPAAARTSAPPCGTPIHAAAAGEVIATYSRRPTHTAASGQRLPGRCRLKKQRRTTTSAATQLRGDRVERGE